VRRSSIRPLLAVAALAAAGLVALTASPASAVTVSDEAELRAAYADVNETVIDLANDIDLTDCGAGDLERNSATPVTVDGHGFTITQTCPNERVIASSGAGGLTLVAVVITGGNAVGNGGGGVFVTGNGPLTIIGSTITGNSAPATGGGGVNGAEIEVIDSTISDNDAADFGGAINGQNVTLVNSTITGNTSAGRAGGVGAADISLVNSTVTGNTAESAPGGGGLFAFGVDLISSTVVDNTAPTSANIYAETGLTSAGSVVALPQGGGENCGGGGINSSNGFNFTDDDSCGLSDSTDTEDGDPGLAPLADNGGPTETRSPEGGPLVDAIPAADCQLSNDQRGVSRPQGPGCDIGAVEVEVAVVPPPPPPTDPGTGPIPATPAFTG
jgi:hypothetical protein